MYTWTYVWDNTAPYLCSGNLLNHKMWWGFIQQLFSTSLLDYNYERRRDWSESYQEKSRWVSLELSGMQIVVGSALVYFLPLLKTL